MRIATWNINSVRLRLPMVLMFLEAHCPDILCLQETKCPDDAFPRSAFVDIGYPHIAIHGEKGYNGVAIISRLPFVDERRLFWAGREDARHISASIEGESFSTVAIHNFYVPAGGDIPDSDSNPKFAHKLDFIDGMGDWFCGNNSMDEPMILLGDLNIAPTRYDVWSHKQLLNIVSYTAIERARLEAMREAYAWVDIVRAMHAAEEQLYSWWSYRARDWAESGRGRRLDHIWVSPCLSGGAIGCEILSHWRGVERPSDHVPIVLDIGV